MAVKVEVRPLLGRQEIDGRIVEDCDTGLDEIVIISKEYPVPKVVGHVGRDYGSCVCMTTIVSASEQSAITKAVAARKKCDENAVTVSTAPAMEGDE